MIHVEIYRSLSDVPAGADCSEAIHDKDYNALAYHRGNITEEQVSTLENFVFF